MDFIDLRSLSSRSKDGTRRRTRTCVRSSLIQVFKLPFPEKSIVDPLLTTKVGQVGTAHFFISGIVVPSHVDVYLGQSEEVDVQVVGASSLDVMAGLLLVSHPSSTGARNTVGGAWCGVMEEGELTVGDSLILLSSLSLPAIQMSMLTDQSEWMTGLN